MSQIDLNADLGEEVTDDAALLAIVSSANLACGYHAGSPEIIRRVCSIAAARGVVVGAHVSYDDRANFGRVAREVAPGTLRDQVADQVGLLARIAGEEGVAVGYLKPHGALYHRVTTDPEQAEAVLEGALIEGVPLPVLGFPGAVILELAEARRVPTRREGFADRRYQDGRLMDRSRPDALLTAEDEIVAAARSLAPTVDSICLHGDTPGAVVHARAVRAGLELSGHTVGACW